MKIVSCSCPQCRALMRSKHESRALTKVTRAARRNAKQAVDRMARTRNWDMDIPTKISIPPIG